MAVQSRAELWAMFAAAALQGMAAGRYDNRTIQQVATDADDMLAEFDKRFEATYDYNDHQPVKNYVERPKS